MNINFGVNDSGSKKRIRGATYGNVDRYSHSEYYMEVRKD